MIMPLIMVCEECPRENSSSQVIHAYKVASLASWRIGDTTYILMYYLLTQHDIEAWHPLDIIVNI